MKLTKRLFAVVLILLMLFIPACANKNASTSEAVKEVESAAMRLVKAEGSVVLTDEDGSDIPIKEDMRLFSGNALETKKASLAGISLDETKAATLGEISLAKLTQKEKTLSIYLEKGEMYFSVSKPLDADESFDINTSTMTMGIRGTSGYVYAVNNEKCVVILTSGSVTVVAVTGESHELKAGQRVIITIKDGSASFDAAPISPDEYPELLLNELSNDNVILQEVSDQNEDLNEDIIAAMAAYKEIINRAESYDYQLNAWEVLFEPKLQKYQYALVTVNATDTIPTLLLRDYTQNYHDYVRVFRYNPQTGTVAAPENIICSDQKAVSSLYVNQADNGDGLIISVNNSGNGRYYSLHKLTFSGDTMNTAFEWEGSITDPMPENLSYHEIEWNDISKADFKASVEQEELPTDGDWIVFAGTMKEYSYDEVIELQGMPDPNPGSTDRSKTYMIITLDEPMEMAVNTVDGTVNKTVKMIYLRSASTASFDESHHIYSVNPAGIWAQSDTSLPLGPARVSNNDNIHVLR